MRISYLRILFIGLIYLLSSQTKLLSEGFIKKHSVVTNKESNNYDYDYSRSDSQLDSLVDKLTTTLRREIDINSSINISVAEDTTKKNVATIEDIYFLHDQISSVEENIQNVLQTNRDIEKKKIINRKEQAKKLLLTFFLLTLISTLMTMVSLTNDWSTWSSIFGILLIMFAFFDCITLLIIII